MRNFRSYTILNAKAATGAGNSILVEDFRHIVLALDTATSANLTIKVQGSIYEDAPNFGAAQTAANQWDYIAIKDLEDGAAIEGDTGVAMSGSDDHRMFEVNVNGLKWLTVNVTARSAGSVTVIARLFND